MNRARIRTLPGASANARQTLTFSLAYVRLMIATSTCSSKTHHANRGSSSQIPFPKSQAVASLKEHIATRLTDLTQNLLLLLVTLVFYYLTYINTTNEKRINFFTSLPQTGFQKQDFFPQPPDSSFCDNYIKRSSEFLLHTPSGLRALQGVSHHVK